MRVQALIKAFDSKGFVVSESLFNSITMSDLADHMEEFVDRLTRRRVPFVRVTQDLAVIQDMRVRGLFEDIGNDLINGVRWNA